MRIFHSRANGFIERLRVFLELRQNAIRAEHEHPAVPEILFRLKILLRRGQIRLLDELVGFESALAGQGSTKTDIAVTRIRPCGLDAERHQIILLRRP